MTIIAVAGIPGSGKTTLARSLGSAKGLPVVSKDVIKESLMDTLGTGDNEWASTLGRAAHGIMYQLVEDLAGDVILEAHFHAGVAEPALEALGEELIQVYCSCPVEIAWERYRLRRDDSDRHPGHLPEHQDETATAGWRNRPPQPLDLDAPLVEVDTTVPVDIESVADAVRRLLLVAPCGAGRVGWMPDQRSELDALAPGLAGRLGQVGGVVGVVLGGSRARGEHRATSDYDLGIYYCGDLDVEELQAIADDYSSNPCEVTQPGGWGPWVDGGGWLSIGPHAVDFIYRDVDRVQQVWSQCSVGQYVNAIQAGHPLGFWSHSYAGELALAIILTDEDQRLGDLKTEMAEYPQPLADALVAAAWEASFSIANARKAVDRIDVAYVAGCLFRAVGVLAHAIHGRDHRWLLNEKGAVAATDRLPTAPPDFASKVAAAIGALAPTEKGLTTACDRLERLNDEALALLT